MSWIRRIYPTRFGQLHLRSSNGKGVPLVMLHPSPRSGALGDGTGCRSGSPGPPMRRIAWGAPHDELIEQTQRVKPLLKTGDVYVDLPDLGRGSVSLGDGSKG